MIKVASSTPRVRGSVATSSSASRSNARPAVSAARVQRRGRSAAPLAPSTLRPLSSTQFKQSTIELNSSIIPPSALAASSSPSPRGLVQHKAEAKIFYRFLSIVYDKIVNPGHWTVPMREAALEPARLKSVDGGKTVDPATLKVADVGGGTGFCTQGVVAAGVLPENITVVDQSPHQLAKAKAKPDLQGVTFVEGDAEDIPLPTDAFDRYTSAGSIEYWPEPQRGICEAYRILKPGGWACLIGPVEPTNPISKFFQGLRDFFLFFFFSFYLVYFFLSSINHFFFFHSFFSPPSPQLHPSLPLKTKNTH